MRRQEKLCVQVMLCNKLRPSGSDSGTELMVQFELPLLDEGSSTRGASVRPSVGMECSFMIGETALPSERFAASRDATDIGPFASVQSHMCLHVAVLGRDASACWEGAGVHLTNASRRLDGAFDGCG